MLERVASSAVFAREQSKDIGSICSVSYRLRDPIRLGSQHANQLFEYGLDNLPPFLASLGDDRTRALHEGIRLTLRIQCRDPREKNTRG
jgi:hypothetical protein